MTQYVFQKITPPTRGEVIQLQEGRVVPPERPIVPFIEGDGIGPDIMRAARLVLDEAVRLAYGGRREIVWFEVYASRKAQELLGELLPADTLRVLQTYRVGLKGPFTTMAGPRGYRSLVAQIRQQLDLYACIRPIRYFRGVPAPVRHPEKVDMVVFRENTEDVYAGLEWGAGSEEARRLREWLREVLGVEVRADAGLGLKLISAYGSRRLVRAALRYAVERGRRSVTLVHKGNIMKYT
ncbi:MAG: isocitrate/isopropylmalate family dehydrogenase, partial [Acidobacteriota bacterium]|nr:isocitrate/isopropylmalate family dehydrogenase [Acidobacteriota bacterium]